MITPDQRKFAIQKGRQLGLNNLYDHQKEAIRHGWLKERFGYFMEQGTGKTLTVLEEAKFMYIDKIIVISPKCAIITWEDEVSKWRSDLDCVYYKKGKRIKKQFGKADVLSINYDSVNSRNGAEVIHHFLQGKRFLIIVDEAHFCKTYNSGRTKAVRFLTKLPNFRYLRLLTGTPTTNGTIDGYSILNLLGSHLGKISESTYKSRFCEMRLVEFFVKGGKTRTAWQISGSKNEDVIAKELKKFSYRVLKDDCLDLPEKVYHVIKLEFPSQAMRIYKEFKEDFYTTLDTGEEVTAECSASKFIRLRQMCSGFVEEDNGEIVEFNDNPKMTALIELLENGEQAIVFCAFTREIEMISREFEKKGVSFGIYQGKTSTDDRRKVKNDFINGEIQVFLAQEDAASTNLTLVQAESIIYYSNSLRLDSRLQSEDRAHRIGLEHKLNIIDLCIKGSIEGRIISLLKDKKDVASIIAGDKEKIKGSLL